MSERKSFRMGNDCITDLLSALQYEVDERDLFNASDLDIYVYTDENGRFISEVRYTPVEVTE